MYGSVVNSIRFTAPEKSEACNFTGAGPLNLYTPSMYSQHTVWRLPLVNNGLNFILTRMA